MHAPMLQTVEAMMSRHVMHSIVGYKRPQKDGQKGWQIDKQKEKEAARSKKKDKMRELMGGGDEKEKKGLLCLREKQERVAES